MGTGRLDGKVILVTGGASGIGAASAARLAEEGATVVIGDITVDGADPSALRMDVADPSSVDAGIATLLERYGRLDCLVHSAGIARGRPFLQMALEEFDRILEINLRGTFIIGQAAAKAMVKTGGGSIVNLASISGMTGNALRSGYGTSKAAVVHLSKIMAVELAEQGIRVNAVCPGPISTPLTENLYTDDIRRNWAKRIPMARLGAPEEVAGGIAFLCSDDASYVTGHALAIDGGFLVAGLSLAEQAS